MGKVKLSEFSVKFTCFRVVSSCGFFLTGKGTKIVAFAVGDDECLPAVTRVMGAANAFVVGYFVRRRNVAILPILSLGADTKIGTSVIGSVSVDVIDELTWLSVYKKSV